MRKKSDDQQTPNDCGQKGELMDYLYGELIPAQRTSFERHLSACASCSDELSAFGRVRDDLSAWQIGFTPRTEVELPRSWVLRFRELFAQTPVWARRMAMAAGAAAILLTALSIAQTRVHLSRGDVAVSFGGAENRAGVASLTREEVDQLVKTAVDRERTKLREEASAQMAALREQLAAEQTAQLQAISAEQRAKLDALKASLKVELARTDRQNRNIRTFFASEDTADLWATGR